MIHQKGITPLWCWITSYKHHLFRITMAVSYKISCYPINTICLWCWITSINQMQISRVGLTTTKTPFYQYHHLEPTISHDRNTVTFRPTSNDMALVFELIEGPTLHETRLRSTWWKYDLTPRKTMVVLHGDFFQTKHWEEDR